MLCDINLVKDKLCKLDKDDIKKEISKKPKLRLFKQICEVESSERYVKLNISSSERSLLAQLRMGILPLRIETGRFSNLKINERLCQMCKTGEVEDEIHFLFKCERFKECRQLYMSKFAEKIERFNEMSDQEKISTCFTSSPRQFGKYLSTIFQEHKNVQYKRDA